jgi:hypothetical protein
MFLPCTLHVLLTSLQWLNQPKHTTCRVQTYRHTTQMITFLGKPANHHTVSLCCVSSTAININQTEAQLLYRYQAVGATAKRGSGSDLHTKNVTIHTSDLQSDESGPRFALTWTELKNSFRAGSNVGEVQDLNVIRCTTRIFTLPDWLTDSIDQSPFLRS